MSATPAPEEQKPTVETVSEYWPPPKRSRVRRPEPIAWRETPYALWMMLRHPLIIGPRLAAASWRMALTVAFCSMLIVMGVVLYLANHPRPEQALATLLSFAIAVPVSAALLAPFISVGERRRHVFGRGVKLMLFAGVYAALGALPMPLVYECVDRLADELDWWCFLYPNPSDSALIAHVAIAAAATIAMALRLGARWPHDGGEPTKTLCRSCGYPLRGLPVGGRCPECGESVAASTPQRRHRRLFATRRSCRGAVATFFRTCWRVQFYPRRQDDFDFRRPTFAAQRFLWGVFAVTALLATIPLAVDIWRERLGDDFDIVVYAAFGFAETLWLFDAQVLAAAVFATLICFFKPSDPRPRVNALCYGGAALLPATVFLAAGLTVAPFLKPLFGRYALGVFAAFAVPTYVILILRGLAIMGRMLRTAWRTAF